jgi:hypothetical protein
MLESGGPTINQAAALDAMLHMRDMFPVINTSNMLNAGFDPNTRVVIFVANLQLLPGEPSSAVTVNLVDNNGQSFNVPAEDVRLLSGCPAIWRLGSVRSKSWPTASSATLGLLGLRARGLPGLTRAIVSSIATIPPSLPSADDGPIAAPA